jgi:tRNA(Arg) A34 adenosine deaminase TadA
MYHVDVMDRVVSAAEALDGPDVPVVSAVAVGPDIVSIAANDVVFTGIPWNHAEFLAVRYALRRIGGRYLGGADLYVTLEPCSFCAALLEKVRRGGRFFGAYDPKCGAIFHNTRLFEISKIRPRIVGGIQEQRCSAIMRNFFERVRR